jgi:hypothetical protein
MPLHLFSQFTAKGEASDDRAELLPNTNDIHRRHRSPHSPNFSKTSKTEPQSDIQNFENTHFLPLSSASGTSYGCLGFILFGGSR